MDFINRLIELKVDKDPRYSEYLAAYKEVLREVAEALKEFKGPTLKENISLPWSDRFFMERR